MKAKGCGRGRGRGSRSAGFGSSTKRLNSRRQRYMRAEAFNVLKFPPCLVPSAQACGPMVKGLVLANARPSTTSSHVWSGPSLDVHVRHSSLFRCCSPPQGYALHCRLSAAALRSPARVPYPFGSLCRRRRRSSMSRLQ